MELENLQEVVARIGRDFRNTQGEGRQATYIPELANVDPDLFAFSVATTDGRIFSAGESGTALSMQSMSKVVCLACALETLGAEGVFSYVGTEPCAEPFNSIVKLELASNKPLNPFINSGAIVVSSLLSQRYGSHALDSVLAFGSRMANRGRGRGKPLFNFNEKIYRSESETASRNRSLAYFLKSTGSLPHDVDETLALYFQLCSVEADSEDLAAIGATIANGGVCPASNERVVSLETIYILLGLMSTCGLYNESGKFAIDVGVPAKSGVSGGILCAVPGLMGIGLFSPPLDEYGNSVAGLKALSYFSKTMKLRRV